MASYSRIKVWVAAEILTASALNTEFNGNITNENDLDTRLIAEITARTELESEHDQLKSDAWNAGANEIATNRVSQNSMKDDSIGSSELKDLCVTDDKIVTDLKDGAAETPCMRSLGITAQVACAGNDSRFLARMEEFAANGVFTAESTQIIVEMWAGGGGGGGGGGGYEPSAGGGGGGGGGGYTRKKITVVVGTEYSIVIGIAGTGGAGGAAQTGGEAGQNGGNTSFAAHVCHAGGGGGAGDNGIGGTGGTGGDTPAYPGKKGSPGKAGTDTSSGVGGDGGATVDDGGLPGNGGTNGAVGANAIGYSGGGGGGGSHETGAGFAGGDGAPGFVRITW